MDFLNSLYLLDILHTLSSELLIPTVIILLLLVVFSIYTIGAVLVEAIVERRKYRAIIPELVARLDDATPEDLFKVVDESGLLRAQKDDLDELISYMYLPEDARTEVAKRLLQNENDAYQRVLGKTDIGAKVAPMLGLMGTLIPLGPGIVALGNNEVDVLSQSLMVAFDTTVVGLVAAVVCFVVSWVRRRWYSDYLVSMESICNTILEKARILHEKGYEFNKTVFHYDKKGRTAKRKNLTSSNAAAKAKIDKATQAASERS